MAQASIFNTTAPQTQTTTATPTTTETESEPTTSDTTTTTENENTTESTTTDAPKQDMVRLADGTEVPAEQYVQSRLAENDAKHAEKERVINSEWERIRQSALKSVDETTTQTQTETRTWNVPKIEVTDQESFQSDVEKTIVSSHNQLGETVNEIGSTVSKEVDELRNELNSKSEELTKEIQATKEEANLLRTQRQIDAIERTKGITEAELNDVYNEFNGTIGDINALAEIVELRKARETASEERTNEANEERKEAVSNVSGGANSAATGQGDEQPKGRGLEGKDRYNGAAIAAKYRAFN